MEKNTGDTGLENIKSLNIDELTAFITGLGYPKFRAGQLYDWLHRRLARHYSEMNNLPKDMRERLEKEAPLEKFETLACLESADKETRKYLFGLADGNAIESVFMKYRHGNSVCISSQVGCRMGCKFCASTIGGLVRNLTAGEMLEQVYEISRLAENEEPEPSGRTEKGAEAGETTKVPIKKTATDYKEKHVISNIVVMGSGEPFDNFDNLIKFIELINSEKGLNISRRNITVSTCGLVPKIKELADLNTGVTLAISLHAYTDIKRKEIMPVANSYSIAEILDACRYFFSKTGRRVSFEYSLIEGVNDSEEDAKGLAKCLAGMGAHVNLIPVNPVKERNFKSTKFKNVLVFQQVLEKFEINATIRREMGADINAACGQLRRSYFESQK